MGDNKVNVIFVLGGPGSGKGTNCTKIADKFGYCHLSAGDLLREERNSGSQLADMINNTIRAGNLVSSEVTVDLLHNAIQKSASQKFLIDGFPRNSQNLAQWDIVMNKTTHVEFVLFLDCPEEEMMVRLLERGKTSGRNDDNRESILKRFKTYTELTQPIIEHFRELNKVRLVRSDQDPEHVFDDICNFFQK